MRTPSAFTPNRRIWLYLSVLGVSLALIAGSAPMAVNPALAGPQGPFRVGDSADPTDSSVALSNFHFGDAGNCVAGACATHVVIGRSDSFPDNLAGAAAARTTAPLILHPPAPAGPDARVMDEVTRVLGVREPFPCHAGDADIMLLGGTAAISQAVEDALSAQNFCVFRADGSNRVDTAVKVAEFMALADGDPGAETISIPRVYLATQNNAADSASASARAAIDGTPILITRTSGLDSLVADFFGTYIPDEVILLGGTAALSDMVEQDVQFTVRNARVSRVQGADRNDTARQVAQQLWPANPANVTVVNGSGDDFWIWALPGAGVAARNGGPLLYVLKSSVPSPTCEYVFDQRPGSAIGVGPEAKVDTDTIFQVRDHADNSRPCTSTGGGPSAPPASRTLIDADRNVSGPSYIHEDEVSLNAGETITIDVTDLGGTDPKVYFYDDNTLLASDDDSGGGLNSQLSFTVSDTKTYFIVIEDLYQNGGDMHLTATATS